MAVAEMLTADTRLWHTRKSRLRMIGEQEPEPRAVQIAGTEPVQMAEAARLCVDRGAQIIDINMGCPAKKVCNVMAGSALLRDEQRVGRILTAVVSAVTVPVTLKMRTGWDAHNRNAVAIARIARDSGIQALTVHGRTRADRFHGPVEYETIRRVKNSIDIPVLANGDIDSADKARRVLDYTGADGLVIGRASFGNPWIFREINHHLATGGYLSPPSPDEQRETLLQHLLAVYAYYGEQQGVRVARKHLSWFFKTGHPVFWQSVCRLESAEQQYNATDYFLCTLRDNGKTITCISNPNRLAA